MIKSTLTAIIMIFLLPQLMLSACKKSETTNGKASPDAHQKEMVKKSFEESKKVTAANVNGEVITMFALLHEMNAIAPQYVAAGNQRTPALDEKIRTDALNTLIFQEMAVQEARKRGMKVNPEIIDREMENTKAKTGPGDAFQEFLDKNGITEKELRKTIEQDALFEMIAAQEIDAKITITDAALRELYKKERARMKDPAHKKLTFEESRSMLEQKARTEAGEKRMREWEKELKKNARIEIIEHKP
jgi:hypothetical protein